MADLILTNANVLLTDKAEAVAVSQGRIVAVGSNSDVLNLRTPQSKVVSLNDLTLMPGFNDAHCHILGFGLDLAALNLCTPPLKSIPEIVQMLQAATPDANGWLRGRGYDQNKLTEHRHPICTELDAVHGNAYILITQTSGHALTVNSRILERAGINRNTPDPPGGTIVRDANGDPTGVLLENAMDLAYAIVPETTHAERVTALTRASQALHMMGITSATDASTSLYEIAAYREAAQSGAMTTRCSLMVLIQQLIDADRTLTPAEVRADNEGDYLKVTAAKLFSDGALTTRTALLREPFSDDPANYGTAMWETDRLNDFICRASEAGWQVASHAIGDKAIDLCLDAYEAALRRAPRADARHRLEHAMLLWDDQIARMARLGILPIYQPEFIARLGDAYITGLGRERADRIMPYQASIQARLPLIFSSDLPVVPGNPLVGMASAVQRRTPNGEILDAAQSVSVQDALRAYTSGGAYSVFAEADRGQLAIGQRADFVILSGDPTALPPDEWPDALHVQATLVSGQVVYGQI